MTAALYARVSTKDKGQHVDLQLHELREYAARRGWAAVEFVDDGASGAKEDRQALQAMLKRVRKREFDVVLVWRFDRFARSTAFLVRMLEEFNHLGVQFASYQENIDTSTPAGRVVYAVIAALTQFEREITVERIHAGLKRAERLGHKTGRPVRSSRKWFEIRHLVGQDMREGLSVRAIAKRRRVSECSLRRWLSWVARDEEMTEELRAARAGDAPEHVVDRLEEVV